LHAPSPVMRGKLDETEELWERFFLRFIVTSTQFREIVESGKDFFPDPPAFMKRA
jgi:hypothetical protein